MFYKSECYFRGNKMNKSLCPACGSLINDSLNVCQCCGLKNLNRTFFIEANRISEESVNSESLIEMLIPKIFVGKDNALFLTHDGELYGVGKNDKHQLSCSDELWLDIPVHLARNVKSATVGLNYIIWADKSGKVYLQGSGEYSDSFQCFDGIAKVLADPFENIFWLIDNHGVVYVFGNNSNGILFPLTEREVYLGEAEFVGDFGKNYRPYGSSRNEIYYLNKETGTVQGVNQYFEKISEYETLLKEYGRINIELNVNVVESERKLLCTSGLEEKKHNESRIYQASAIIKNLHIIRPVKTSLTEAGIKIPLQKQSRFFYKLTPPPHSLIHYESCLESLERKIRNEGHFQENVGENSSFDVVAVYEHVGGNIYVMLTRDCKILLARTERLFNPYAINEPKGVKVYAFINNIPKIIGHTSFYIF